MIVKEFTKEDIQEAAAHLADATPQQVLRWAADTFYPRLTMATAFGVEGCCIIHMLSEIEPRVRIFNLETGYQFKESLIVRERIKEKYGIEVEYIYPDTSVPVYEVQHGGPLYKTNPDQCCHDRKIVPLRRAVQGYDAWISSIRSEQTQHRKAAQVVQWDSKFNLVKINPLLKWTKKDVWNFVTEHGIPYNQLHDQNYPSIGCWPCTRAIGEGEDERAGRWSGTEKKECGLHVLEQDGSGI